jgi:hypothetical protein
VIDGRVKSISRISLCPGVEDALSQGMAAAQARIDELARLRAGGSSGQQPLMYPLTSRLAGSRPEPTLVSCGGFCDYAQGTP